ncbi:MAG: M20/M25/M40 family metallo-hydrolase [Reichenbachiella sp.]|uniref:M20/M25/M40 family metallo-hydrolase n=1 Tax=Reichenbachiella sp. TaxID=2184521 RepID=UPI0032669102
MKRIIAIVFLLTSVSTAYCQNSKIEKSIIKSVDKNNQTYVQLLKDIVNTNSGTMNFDGVREVGVKLKPEFETLGLEVRWESGEAFNRAGHLVAVNHGSVGPKMLLIGHLDTVFEPDSPFQSYEMLNDSLIRGPGVIDMKGGDVIILAALRALKEAGVLDQMQIEVVLTGDEEKSGSPLNLSKQAIIEASARADIALAFENADGDPATIVVTRRGSAGWKLDVKGNAAHSSQIFTEKVGVGAVYETSRILTEFYKQLSNEENLTFNPGVILGGTAVSYDKNKNGGTASGKSNVVAQQTIVNGDIRAVSLEQLAKAKQIMTQIANENMPGTSAELTFKPGGYPPLTETAGNHKLLGYYSQVSKDLGYGPVVPVHPRKAGAADVSFTNGLVDMAIDGLGLSGTDDHTIKETGNLNYLPIQTKRAAVLMYRIAYGKL